MPPKFTVRVYGLCIRKGFLLVSSEIYGQRTMTKFPGGGLEEGESTIDALKREWLEELNLTIHIIDHFYTTDFHVTSAFDKTITVLSIYYLVDAKDEIVTDRWFENTENNIQEKHQLSWVEINKLDSSNFTFPTDQKVVELIKEKNINPSV